MKVVIATTTVPFVQGGATLLTEWLAKAMRQRGHEVEVFGFPFRSDPATMPTQMVGLRSLDLSDRCDHLITLRTPSYLIRHPRKSVWFLHHHRPAYDLWEGGARDVADDPDGREFRRMMFAADEKALSECRLFCNSAIVQERLRHFNGLEAEVLYPPLDPGGGYPRGSGGDTIVYPSRVVSHKRQLLAVEAMSMVTTEVRLDLIGAFESADGLRGRIQRLIAEHDLGDRVTMSDGWVDEDEKRRRIADSLAVAYLPLDEDSYGYPSLEAAEMGRPVVTTADSGGVQELVVQGRNGLVVEPTPEALAAAFDRLFLDRVLADRLGSAQQGRLDELHIDWDHVVARLLA